MTPPPRQLTVPLKSPARTPTSSPQKRAMIITQIQKQALIDNLRLEVTERARKLRAQYSLQAQSLRTRIELRINRVPSSLRRVKMGDLIEKHLEKPKQVDSKGHHKSGSSKSSTFPEDMPFVISKNSSAPRGTKRKSGAMEISDKENAIDHIETLPNSKKRTKVAAHDGVRKATNPSTILSPKSSNSRTLPQPSTGPLPQKPYLSYPTSPLKPPPIKVAIPSKASAIKVGENTTNRTSDKARSTRAKVNTGRKATNLSVIAKSAAKKPKRGGMVGDIPSVEARSVSNSSSASNTSSGTVVKKRSGNPIGAAVAAASIPAAGMTKKKNGVRTAGKPSASTKGAVPPAERRVLRKRV